MKRILVFGDSNTWGFNPERFDRYPEEIRWTSLLQKSLGDDALIIEEGLELENLERILRSMRDAAAAAGVQIVTGDTKVVDRGRGDKLYINTAGIG